MKRISFLIITLLLCAVHDLRAQDARTEERLNKLSGQIEDLIASQEAQKKRFSELMREIESLREQIGKPNNSYASQEDLKRLARSVEEVDRKRVDDGKKVEAAAFNSAASKDLIGYADAFIALDGLFPPVRDAVGPAGRPRITRPE